MGSWSLFFSQTGLPSTLRSRRSLAPFADLERRIRWNCPSFARVSLARVIDPDANRRHVDVRIPHRGHRGLRPGGLQSQPPDRFNARVAHRLRGRPKFKLIKARDLESLATA